MKKRLVKAAVLKKIADRQGGVKTVKNPHLLHVAQFEAGDLYEGVTDNAQVSSSAEYRMITRSDDTVNTQGS